MGLRRVGVVGSQDGSCVVGKQGKTRVRARVAAAGRRCGACHIPTRHNINMALRHWGAHGDILEFSVALACAKSPVSRTSGTIYVVR